MRILLCLYALLVPFCGHANPYFPIQTGDVMTYDYKFYVDTTKKEFKSSDTHGSMITTVGRQEEKGGKSYYRMTTTYHNIPYQTEPVVTWAREADGDIFTGAERQGKFSETLLLPKNVAVGAEWDYNDGEQSRRRVTSLVTLEVGGKQISNCIEVVRKVVMNEKFNSVENKDYYCPDLGEVKYFFKMPSPVGPYITEMQLLERKKHGKEN